MPKQTKRSSRLLGNVKPPKGRALAPAVQRRRGRGEAVVVDTGIAIGP